MARLAQEVASVRRPAGGPAEVRSGVCVTGEARSFRWPGVRRSLRSFLTAVNAVEVRITISRTSACEGLVLRRNNTLCAVTRAKRFDLPISALQAEFPTATLTVLERSACDNGHNDHEWCCTGDNGSHASRPKSAFLQYVEIARCISLLSLRALTHVIRTRPDLIYLNVTRAFDVSTVALPTVVRKAMPGSLQSRLRHWVGPRCKPNRTSRCGYYSHGSSELSQPGDWFMVSPALHAARFFGNLIQRMRASCHAEAPASATPRYSASLAASLTPEARLLTDHRGRFRGTICGANASYHLAHAHLCLASWPIAQVSVDGAPTHATALQTQTTVCARERSLCTRTVPQRTTSRVD
jgi:hypothetical protein